jgi:predicted Zn-dependent protease
VQVITAITNTVLSKHSLGLPPPKKVASIATAIALGTVITTILTASSAWADPMVNTTQGPLPEVTFDAAFPSPLVAPTPHLPSWENIPVTTVAPSTGPSGDIPQELSASAAMATVADPNTALSTIETELYHRVYPQQPFEDRLRRLETTFFGTARFGNPRSRLDQVAMAYDRRQNQASQAKQQAMVSYLETKLFGQSTPNAPWGSRLDQLETHVFSRTFEHYPEDLRIKKLTYALPMVVSNVSVSSSNDTLVARTAPGEMMSYANRPLYAASTTSAGLADSAGTANQNAFISGDYLGNVYRSGAQGLVLRWQHTPVMVATLRGTEADQALVKTAVERWKTIFPLQLTTTPYAADILVDFQARPPVNATNSTTGHSDPIVFTQQHLSASKQIRSVVVIAAGKGQTLSSNYKTHALAHWLGHALGIWGHSPIPEDLMYPVHPLEITDIPERWNRRSSKSSIWAAKIIPIETSQPSTRDLNTLTRLYTQPFQSLAEVQP